MTADELRHHLLLGVVERVARSPERDAFVLRGGLLTRAWIAPHPRATRDLDFVGDFPFDRDATAARFRTALGVAMADDVRVDASRLTARAMWESSGFPGVRLAFPIGLGGFDEQLQIDVGFGDPLVPPATEIALARRDGTAFTARAVRPETQVGWKLHGLVEMGTEWRPKDLADLDLITRHVALDRATLPDAIRVAFESRGYDPARAVAIFGAAHWPTKTSRLRWEPYERRHGQLAATLATVRARLGELR